MSTKPKYTWTAVAVLKDPNGENLLTSAHGSYLASSAKKAVRTVMVRNYKDTCDAIYVMLCNISDHERPLSDVYCVSKTESGFTTKKCVQYNKRIREIVAPVSSRTKTRAVVHDNGDKEKKLTPHTMTTKCVHGLLKEYFVEDYQKFKTSSGSSLIYKLKDVDMTPKNIANLVSSGRGLSVVFTLMYNVVISRLAGEDVYDKVARVNDFLERNKEHFIFHGPISMDMYDKCSVSSVSKPRPQKEKQPIMKSSADLFRLSSAAEPYDNSGNNANAGCIIS